MQDKTSQEYNAQDYNLLLDDARARVTECFFLQKRQHGLHIFPNLDGSNELKAFHSKLSNDGAVS